MTAGMGHERKGEIFPCAGVVVTYAWWPAGSGLPPGVQLGTGASLLIMKMVRR